MDIFNLDGSVVVQPGTGAPSGDPVFSFPLAETLNLSKTASNTVELTVNTPVSVAFGGLSSASVVLIKTVGGKVRVRFTSGDGADQSVPVDTFLLLVAASAPITAIDLERVSGQDTTVKVFLGQAA